MLPFLKNKRRDTKPASPKILETRGLCKRFHIHHIEREITVLENVDFSLPKGTFLRIAGPNGAGKSSLLRCLYRTYLPTAGAALYHSLEGSVDLARASDIDLIWLRRREIGFVTQFLRPRPRVTALELVTEPLLDEGHSADASRDNARDILQRFGLRESLWNAYPTTFSGGEQQKVNLARSLSAKRRLLLLDEPTASLDAGARAAVAARLGELKAQGVSMIGVAHHPEDLKGLIDNTLELQPAETADSNTHVVA